MFGCFFLVSLGDYYKSESIKAQRTFLPYHFLAKLVSIRGANTEQVHVLCQFVKKSAILARVNEECHAELAWA